MRPVPKWLCPSENDEEGVTVARNDSDVDAKMQREGATLRGGEERRNRQKKSLGENTEARVIACVNKLLSPRL
jgi:hypothetical protein